MLQWVCCHYPQCHLSSKPVILYVVILIMLMVAPPLCLKTSKMQSSLLYISKCYPWVSVGSAPKCSKSSSGCWAKPYKHHHHYGSSVSTKMAAGVPWAAHGHTPETVDNIPKPLGKRKVVEHVVLFKTEEGFSDEQEKDMLDFLYTSQYYIRGIMAVSLGCIVNINPKGYTHALYMRFPSKAVLEEYYRNTFQSRVLNEYILPYCHGSISVDYEAEVEDDIIPLFRRGEDFEYGAEFFLLISVYEDASADTVKDALDAFANLIQDFGSTIIQYTQGSNISNNSKDYTHGIIIRFPSEEAIKIFTSSTTYNDMWEQKILPITRKTLMVYVLVDPVGTTVM